MKKGAIQLPIPGTERPKLVDVAMTISREAMRLLQLHKEGFHGSDSPKCFLCNSLRRALLRGSR